MAAVRVNAAMSAQTVCAIAYVWMLGIFGFPKGSKYQYSGCLLDIGAPQVYTRITRTLLVPSNRGIWSQIRGS